MNMYYIYLAVVASLMSSLYSQPLQYESIHLRPYGVVWNTNASHVRDEVYTFMKNNKKLAARLLFTTSLLPEALYKIATNQGLNSFFELFHRVNPTGEVKDLATRLTYEAKQTIPSGLAFMKWCLDQHIPLSYCVGVPKSHWDNVKQKFPFLQKIGRFVNQTREILTPNIEENKKVIVVAAPEWKQYHKQEVQEAKRSGCNVMYVDVNNAQSIDSIKQTLSSLITKRS